MTTTTERPQATVTDMRSTRRRGATAALFALVGLAGLFLGLVIGYAAFDDAGSDDVYVLGAEELTEEQEQMVALVRGNDSPLTRGWLANDGDAVADLFHPERGVLTVDGTFESRADDGTIVSFIEDGDWSTLNMVGPVVVRGNRVTTYNEFRDRISTNRLVFTVVEGEVLVVRHDIS